MLYSLPAEYHTIDAHNHVWLKAGVLDQERMQFVLDASESLGIEKICVSTPILSPCVSAEKCRIANNAVIEAMAYSDKFIGFCFVDAAAGGDAVAEIDRCILQHGMRGIKLYHQHKVQSRTQAPVMKRAAELGVPILMHAGLFRSPETIARGPLTSNAEDFLEALEVYPDTMFIQGHIGGGGDWQWNLRALEVIESDNYWIDLSGSVHDAGILRATVDTVGCDRVLFATDGSYEESVAKLLAAKLSKSEMLKITSGNFAKIMSRRKAEVKDV